jgi:tRNA(Arg) A34 adenosine deaminase TadA
MERCEPRQEMIEGAVLFHPETFQVLFDIQVRPGDPNPCEIYRSGYHLSLQIVDQLARQQHAEHQARKHTGILPGSDAQVSSSGPYLATGYDLCINFEPCILCAMALLHSRIRRVFYLKQRPERGGLGSLYSIHRHPALNHHFSVYKILEQE